MARDNIVAGQVSVCFTETLFRLIQKQYEFRQLKAPYIYFKEKYFIHILLQPTIEWKQKVLH